MQFITTLRADLDAVPYIKGMNNHMGSQLTQNTEAMSWVMDELQQRGLYFVDSRTSAQTRALDVAQAHRIPSLKRDVFLDDVETPAAVNTQLHLALQLAHSRGSALAIGHPYKVTLDQLEQLAPLLAQTQVSLVFVSQLTHSSHNSTAPITESPTPATAICTAPPRFARTRSDHNFTWTSDFSILVIKRPLINPN